MSKLNRVRVGVFKIDKAITLQQIEENKDNIEFFKNNIITIEEIFKEYERIILENKKLEDFLNGVKISCDLDDGICKVYDEQRKFIGIAEIKNKKLKRDVII